MLSVAQLLRIISNKTVYLLAILIFELGSVICGAVCSVPNDCIIFIDKP